jgi:hypothetical protein
VCYDPFEHKDNIFSQIGLLSITAIGETLERPIKATSLLARNYGDPIDLSKLAKNSPVKELLTKRQEKEAR